MLDRLFSRWRGRRASPPASAPSRPIEDADSPWRLLTRSPLLDKTGGIAGWRVRPLAGAVGGEAAAARAARALAARGATVVTPLPAGPIDRAPLAQLCRGCVVEVTDDHLAAFAPGLPATVDALRARGITVATAQRALALLVPPDWILIEANGRDAGEMTRLREGFGVARPWIVLGLRSLAQTATVLRAGATLAGGALVGANGGNSTPSARTTLPPRVLHAAKILDAILEDRPPKAIAALISADAATVYRILRSTNELAHQWGLRRGSLADALRMWDVDERHRRACALVVTAADARPFARSLQELALTRARLMETIALLRKDAEAPPAALFATGAFSLLGALLDVPPAVALPLLPLPRAAQSTLLEQNGPWRSYLELAIAVEGDDVGAIESAAQRLGLDANRALGLHGGAAEWAADVTAEMTDAPVSGSPRAPAA